MDFKGYRLSRKRKGRTYTYTGVPFIKPWFVLGPDGTRYDSLEEIDAAAEAEEKNKIEAAKKTKAVTTKKVQDKKE